MTEVLKPESFFEILGPFRKRAVFLLALFVVSAALETLSVGAVLPLLSLIVGDTSSASLGLAWLDNLLSSGSEQDRMLFIGGGVIALYFFRSVFLLFREYYASHFTCALREYWTSRAFRNFLYGDMLELSKHKHGYFVNTMVNEPIYASKGVHALIEIVVSGLILVAILSLLLTMNAMLTLIALGVIALGILSVWRLSSKYSENVGKKRVLYNQRIQQLVAEAVSGIRQIKVFSAEGRAHGDMKSWLAKLMRMLNMFALVNASPKAIGEFVIVALMIGALFIGKFVFHRDLSGLLPMLGLFSVAFMKLFSMASLILSKRMEVATYWPSIRAVHALSKSAPFEKTEEPGAILSDAISLSAQNLSFHFPDGPQVLHDISFDIAAGQIIGLAGKSGSGKSTLCDLIAKIVRPTGGALSVNGQDLASMGPRAWRKRLGYVSQEPFLFHGSVQENILIGCPDAPAEIAVQAATLAQAHEFIEQLPERYATLVGAGGAGLSGGQKQRLALARALARRPSLLIMDEATSGLDFEAEAKVFDMLRKNLAGTTIILVTHRLHTLKQADHILFLESGKIVESGHFDELYDRRGAFRKLVDSDLTESG